VATEGRLTAQQYRQLKSLLLADIADVAVCDASVLRGEASVASAVPDWLHPLVCCHLGTSTPLP
jgi:hypothetical protein